MFEKIKALFGESTHRTIEPMPQPVQQQQLKEELDNTLKTVIAQAVAAKAPDKSPALTKKNIFISGWRPFIGWICGFGIMWAFVIQPVLTWFMKVSGDVSTPIPPMETDGLYQLVLAVIGMGGLRTYEKMKGVAREK